jgi:hypothetical protein
MASGKADEILVAFKSGHFKKVKGTWKGDSVWMHLVKESGGMVHVNKAEVEYVESFGPSAAPKVDLEQGLHPISPEDVVDISAPDLSEAMNLLAISLLRAHNFTCIHNRESSGGYCDDCPLSPTRYEFAPVAYTFCTRPKNYSK